MVIKDFCFNLWILKLGSQSVAVHVKFTPSIIHPSSVADLMLLGFSHIQKKIIWVLRGVEFEFMEIR